jgi:hypothetical protein
VLRLSRAGRCSYSGTFRIGAAIGNDTPLRIYKEEGLLSSPPGTKLPIWNVRASVAIRGKADIICSF